jgi:hypothetical protein
MRAGRREFIQSALATVAAAVARASKGAENQKLGIPGPYPGRVIAVEHSGSIVGGAYQRAPVQQMIKRGMRELTGAPSWQDAWRVFFEKGDVVGIKVSPVGGRDLCSDALVLTSILDGLQQAGVPNRDVIVFNRYREEALEAGIDKWLSPGCTVRSGKRTLR